MIEYQWVVIPYIAIAEIELLSGTNRSTKKAASAHGIVKVYYMLLTLIAITAFLSGTVLMWRALP